MSAEGVAADDEGNGGWSTGSSPFPSSVDFYPLRDLLLNCLLNV
jgi:hypothetical protein